METCGADFHGLTFFKVFYKGFDMVERDYYLILNVEKNASASEIKHAYRDLALKYHPDKNKDNPEALEKMKEINEAYAVLSNPDRRKEYDALKSNSEKKIK